MCQRDFEYFYDNRHQLIGANDGAMGYVGEFQYLASGRLDYARISTAPGAPISVPREVDYDYGGASDPEAVDVLRNMDGTVRASYDYDEASNIIKRTEGKTKVSFVYDGNNRQRIARDLAGTGDYEVYYYDHNGQRMLSVTKDASGFLRKARQWFGETEIWYDGVGAQEKTWVHVSLGQPVARIERAGSNANVEYSYHSTLGHLLVSLDDQNQITAGFTYGAFGEILAQVGSGDNHLRRFNGKEYDTLSALSYYGFRYYDSLALGWTQADPLYRFVPDMAFDAPRLMNLYAFSLNNPLRYVDPDGLDGKQKVKEVRTFKNGTNVRRGKGVCKGVEVPAGYRCTGLATDKKTGKDIVMLSAENGGPDGEAGHNGRQRGRLAQQVAQAPWHQRHVRSSQCP